MATRDETLRLQFEVEGIGNLRDLRTQIDALGEQGQQSATELSQLTDALANTGALQQSLARLRELGQQYVGLQQRIRETQAATVALDAASKQAAATQGATRAAIADQEEGLRRLAVAAERGEVSEEQRQRASAEARAEIQRLTAELREAETAQRRYDAELEKSRGTISKLAAQQDRLREPIQQIRGELEKAGVASKSYTGAQAELQARAQQSRSALDALAGSVSRQVGANRAAAASVQALAQANETLGRRGFGDITAEIAKVRSAYETLRSSGTLSTRELAQAQSRLIERTRELRGEYGSLGNSLQQVQGSLIAAGASLFTVTRLLSNAAASASQFQRSLAAISTIAPQADLQALGDSVRELTREFGGDASRNAAALYEIIAAGVEDTTQALEILRVANQLAIGGLADTETAASGLVATLNAYGLAAEEATRVSDAFFVSAAAGNTTIEELSQSIGGVAPLAASVGVSIEQLTSAVGALTAGGLDTGQAFTQIQSALTAVVKPTAEAQKAAEALGIQFDVAALRSQGLQQFLQGVSDAAQGNETTLATLFGRVEGLQGVLALTGNQADAFAKALADMEQGAGRTAEAFAKLQETPEARLQLFRAAVGDLQISFGQAVTALKPLLDGLTSVINLFNELPTSVRTGIAGVTALAAVIAPLAIAIAQSRAALVLLLGSLRAIGPAAAGAGAGVGVYTTAANAATAATARLNLSLGRLGKSFAAVGVAVAGFEVGQALGRKLNEVEVAATETGRSVSRLAQEIDQAGEAGARQAAQFSNFADVQVKSAEAATQLGDAQREAYRTALEGLEQYLQGRGRELIAIKQRGEATAEELAELDQTKQRLAEVRQSFEDLDRAGLGAAESIAAVSEAADSAPVTKLADEIRRAAREGKGLEEAVAGAFDGIDFENEAGRLGLVALAFDEVSRTAGVAGQQIRDTIAKEIAGLSGRELLRFQQAAEFAFDNVGKSGRAAGNSLAQVFEIASRRLGVSLEAAGVQISEEGGNIIATFQTLAQSGLTNANVIEQGFKSALARVSTSAEVKALGDALASSFAQGKISAQQYDQALQLIQKRQQEIKNESLGIEPPAPPPPDVSDGYNKLGNEIKKTGEEAEKAGESIEKSGEAAQAAGGFGALYAQQLLQLREEFKDTSQAALDLFLSYQKLAARGGAGSDLLQLLDALAGAGDLARRAIQAQRAEAELLSADLAILAQATDAAGIAASNFGAAVGGSSAAASESLQSLIEDVDLVAEGVAVAGRNLNLLDKATLQNLRNEAQSAADAIARIEEQSRSAVEEIARLNREFRDDADRAAGNEEAIRRRAFEDQLRRIDELEQRGGAAAQREADEARRLAQEALERDLRNIRERERAQRESDEREQARKRADREREDRETRADGDRPATRREPVSPRPQSPTAGAGGGITINITGPVLGTPEDLARSLRTEIAKLDRLGFNPRIGR